MKESILLIGGGGHCKACIDVVEQTERFEIAGIVDLPDKVGRTVLGHEIIGNDEALLRFLEKIPNVLLTLGQIGLPARRLALFKKLKLIGAVFPTIISPLAYVSPHAHVEEGTIVMHHAVVNAGASVGINCIINTRALVEHDAVVGDHCHVSTGAIVNGGVEVGEKTFIGSNAVCQEYARIPTGSLIKSNRIVKRE